MPLTLFNPNVINNLRTFAQQAVSRTLIKAQQVPFRELASLSHTPDFHSQQPKIIRLSVIEDILASVKKEDLPNLSKTVVVGVQHMLNTTPTLLEAMHRLGVPYENMYFGDKCYSSNPESEKIVSQLGVNLTQAFTPVIIGHYLETTRRTIKKIWNQVEIDLKENGKEVDRIIILDEGGRCIEYMPKALRFELPIAALEQTQAGLNSKTLENIPFPLIEVASSAAKKRLESPLIANAVLSKLKKLLPKLKLDKNTVCGIIGNGAIGSAVAKHLLSEGYKVAVYDGHENAFHDIENPFFFRLDSISSIITNAKYIFGCTGNDSLKDIAVFTLAKDDTTFVNCTPEVKEFESLLKRIAQSDNYIENDPLEDVIFKMQSGNMLTIKGGGFPINFDRSPESVPANDIQLTRGLLLTGFIQACLAATKPVNDGKTINRVSRYMIDPYAQKFIVNRWKQSQPAGRYKQELLDLFNNEAWIAENSGGRVQLINLKNWFSNDPINQINIPKTKL